MRLLKRVARVQAWKDRITLSLPSSCPVAPVLRHSLTLLAWVRLASQALNAIAGLDALMAKRLL